MKNKLKKIFKKLFLDKNGRIVVAQFPNVPITIWFLGLLISTIFPGLSYINFVNIIATSSLIIWTALEIYSGVNLFRKILGIAVLIILLISWI